MRITKIFAIIFLTTFFIGYTATLFLVKESFSIKEEKIISPTIENLQLEEEPPEKFKEPFAPQIFGLKDFSDEAVKPKYKIKLVDVLEHGNSYRKDEVIARNGETWLGLFFNKGGTFLKDTKVKIDFGFEADDEWAEIKFKKSKPLFLLKNVQKLKKGNVTTLFQENSSDDIDFENRTNTLSRGFNREFRLGERKYTLQIKDALTKLGQKVLALVLETDGVSQVVTYEPYFDNDYLGSLLWAGDLDGDGKLDFYLDHNDWEKGYFRSNLFLSSESGREKLVKEVAGFYTAGC